MKKGNPGYRPALERLPPHSQEAEAGLLGSVLLDPQAGVPEVLMRFGDKEPFYDARHQAIWRAMVALYDRNEPIELISLLESLRADGLLDKVGGAAYLSGVQDNTPTAASMEYYSGIVYEKALLREMVKALTEGLQSIYEAGSDQKVRAILDGIEAAVLRVNQHRGGDNVKTMLALCQDLMHRLDEYQRGRGLIHGIRTGYGYLDKVIGGLHHGEMCVFAARPGLGKTSLAMNVAENVSIGQKVPVGVFSMEMSADDIAFRMVCARSRANLHQIRTGFMHKSDQERITEHLPEVSKAPVYIDDTPSLDVLELRSRARRMVQRFGVQLIIIDYLQLMQAKNAENRTVEITRISNGVKALAKELNLPVMVLAQLNREFEKETKRIPRLADLRESGAIEQDADLVAMLYRAPSENADEDDESGRIPVNINIAKQRNGPTGQVEMIFLRDYMRYEDKYAGKGKKDAKPVQAEAAL